MDLIRHALSSPWCHRHHRPIGRGGAGQAHRRWKMCDGWPACPAPSRFYSTPIGTDPDPYPRLPLVLPHPPATRRRLRRRPRKGEGD